MKVIFQLTRVSTGSSILAERSLEHGASEDWVDAAIELLMSRACQIADCDLAWFRNSTGGFEAEAHEGYFDRYEIQAVLDF